MTHNMTKGNPFKLLLVFSIPVFLGNLFQQLYNLVDSIVVGRYDGVVAFAAIGATSYLVFMVMGWLNGLTNGFSILIAQSFGAKDMKRLRHYVAMSYYLSIGMTLVLTVVLLIFNRTILLMLNTPDNIIEHAKDYLAIIYVGLIATVLYNLLASILRALGDSKTPLYFLCLAAFINVVLDILFVAGFRMGVKGASYATVISQGISAICCFLFMKKKYHILKLEKEDMVFSFDSAKRLFSLGIPMGLQFSIIAIGGIIVQMALNKLGANAVAAFSASSKVHSFITQIFPAIGVAIATYVGQNIGAGDYRRVKSGVVAGIKLALICSIIAFFIVRIFGEPVAASFIANAPAKVHQLNHIYFNINSWFYPFLCLIFVFRNAIQGMGDGVVPMISGTLELVARAVIIFLLASPFGFAGICFADPLAWMFALIPLVPVFIIRLRKMLKRQAEREMELQLCQEES